MELEMEMEERELWWRANDDVGRERMKVEMDELETT